MLLCARYLSPPFSTTEVRRVMERSPALQRDDRIRLVSILDPYRYVQEADRALLRGDREQARSLISQAYQAFDLCAAGCEQAKTRDRGSLERNS
jgi:hypothetical protein